jgi:RNA polymerase sigma factor (sigma-70 family)
VSDTYRTIPTGTLLQRVARARAAGDWRIAEDEWHACIARAHERVVTVVDRYVAKGWIAASDRDDVAQDALLRGARALVENLDSLQEGAFFAGMVQCAKFQALDAARKHIRREQHVKPLDAPSSWSEPDREQGRYDAAAHRAAEEHWRREDEIRAAAATLDELIPRLRDVRARKLLTLQRLGVPDAQIATELGISVANAQTIRSRALKELRGLIDT